MKIDTMVDVFLNAANFAKHAFFTLAPPAILISNLITEKYPFNVDQIQSESGESVS